MQDTTATPETGPVDAPASLDSVVAEFSTGEPPTDAIDEIVSEVKEPEDEGQAEEAPDAEESATDPIEPDEEAEEAPPEEELDAEAEPQADDPVHKVKVNGEEKEVPLSELLKGYSRTEDYKFKTMALADERRSLEQAKATVEADVKSQYANELKQQIDAFEALDPVLSEARLIDWDKLKAEDPATFVQYSDAVNQRLALIDGHRAKIAQAEGERAKALEQQAEAEKVQRMEAAANKIVEAMPELKEGDNFSRFATEAIETLRESGFTPEEINEAVDDRALLLASDARKWRALQRAKTGLPAKKIVPKSAVKPMKTDASDTARTSARFPVNAPREDKGDWIVNEILSSE